MVPMAPHNLVYTPNINNCLFNFTLPGNDISSLGSVTVLVVARNSKNRTYPAQNLPQYLVLNFVLPPPYLCTPAGEDIRTIVSAELEEMNELIVMEVLDASTSDCENNGSSGIKYFGRGARLIFNSSAASEYVLQ